MLGGAINMGSSTSTDTSTKQVSIASALESTNAINVRVGNSATFEGADISAKTTTFTKTDPATAGQLNLNGSVDTTQTAHTEKSDTMGVYQSQSGSGSTTQTLNLTKINGAVNIDQNLAVAVQLPKTVTTSGDKANTAAATKATNATSQASVQAQIDELSKQPGLAYLKQLSSNAAKANPAQWSQVQLAHDNWNYSQSGLTPAGAALLSIAVAAYAPGLSSGLTSSITATAGASAAAAASAGFAALQAQAAVAMVNNGGDIGKTLQQLGSEQSVKALLTTMATAGALQSLDKALGYTDSTHTVTGQNINATGSSLASNTSGVATSQATNAFQQNLLKNVTNNVAGSAIDAAISGKAFDEKTLSTALSNALITAGMAQGANSIGDAATGKNGNPAQINSFTQKVAHAVLGCAGGAAIAGNGSGCSAGAVGAVVGEMAADYYLNNNSNPALTPDQNKANALAFAKVISATSGVLVGGGSDNVAAVNIANTTGANAAANNRLLHPKELEWISANGKSFAAQLSKTLGRVVSENEAMQWLTAAGESDVDAGMQRSNGQFVRSTSNNESSQAYDAAKAFINSNAKTNFVDSSNQTQTLFMAKGSDFYNPTVNSQYRNDASYRDFYWSTMGLNLKGDKMTPQEQALYDQRQVIVGQQTVKDLALMAGAAVVGRLAVSNSFMNQRIAAERAANEGVYQRIVEIPKGQKPGPETYLSESYINTHLQDFRDSGIVRFTSGKTLTSYGTAGPDGGFAFPKNKFDSLMSQSNGNLSVVEQKLGLPNGYLSTGDTVAVYIKPNDIKGLRIPSGNESGALPSKWIPGGYTKGGMPEAVMDFSYKPPITILRINGVNK